MQASHDTRCGDGSGGVHSSRGVIPHARELTDATPRNALMKTLLAIITSLTVLATGYLSLSLLILRPPHANYYEWIPMATLFLVEGVLTLVAVGRGGCGRRIRSGLASGGIAIRCVGSSC